MLSFSSFFSFFLFSLLLSTSSFAGSKISTLQTELSQALDPTLHIKDLQNFILDYARPIQPLFASSDHSCALFQNKVFCWGRNQQSQLGDRTKDPHPKPTLVLGLREVTAIAGSAQSSCAIHGKNRRVSCWGTLDYGGLKTLIKNKITPLTPIPGIENATSVAVGYLHACATLDNGHGVCWGNNSDGQLGNGKLDQDYEEYSYFKQPTPVSRLKNAISIVAGLNHSCAILKGGQVACWGDNLYGQLGDGTSKNRLRPTLVLGLTNVTSLSAGAYYTCAAGEDGKAFCWGRNDSGQLGDGTKIDHSTPTPIAELENVLSISAGSHHTCATTQGGKGFCWGANIFGELGNGSKNKSLIPTPILGFENILSIANGDFHSCANLMDNSIACWGRNLFGELGNGRSTENATSIAEKCFDSLIETFPLSSSSKNWNISFEPNVYTGKSACSQIESSSIPICTEAFL